MPASPKWSTRLRNSSSADEHQVGFPIFVHATCATGRALARPADPRPPSWPTSRQSMVLKPLQTPLEHIPAAELTRRTRSRWSRTSMPSPYVRRACSAVCVTGSCARATWSRGRCRRHDAERQDHRAVGDRGARPRRRDRSGPGDIIAIAGLADVTIGETLADPDDPRPLPVIHVDDPVDDDRHQHVAALGGRFQAHGPPRGGPARRRSGRATCPCGVAHGSPRRVEVQGRGELQLAVLVDMTRREASS